jgi:streptogramin lyase
MSDDYTFINKFSESNSINNIDYTIIDSYNETSASYNTKKISLSNFKAELQKNIATDAVNKIDTIESNINSFQTNLSNKLDKRGLSYNSNEKMIGTLVVNSTLTAFENSTFNKNINLNYNLINNLSVISPIDDFDGLNKKYIDDRFNSFSVPNVNLFVGKAGDTMTGSLSLHADPTESFHASTKKYVDEKLLNLNFVRLSGNDTITGGLTVIHPPLQNLQIATKKYIDDKKNSLSYLPKDGGSMEGVLTVLPLTKSSQNYIANKSYVLSAYNDITGLLSISGGNIVRPLSVINPINEFDIVNKRYVDNNINYSNYICLTGGKMIGGLTALSPIDSNEIAIKSYVDNLASTIANSYVHLSGNDTITGDVILQVSPTQNLQIATKKYVDDISKNTEYLTTEGGFVSKNISIPNTTFIIGSRILPKIMINGLYVRSLSGYANKFLTLSGGNITGPLSVYNANTPFEIANKSYVDDLFSAGLYVPVAGNVTMRGDLSGVNQIPSQNKESVTKEYVDNVIKSGEYVQISGGKSNSMSIKRHIESIKTIGFSGAALLLKDGPMMASKGNTDIFITTTIEDNDKIYKADFENNNLTIFSGIPNQDPATPGGLAISAVDVTPNNLFVSDSRRHVIYKGTTIFAGKVDTAGSTNSTRTNSTFSYPYGIVFDSAGNLFICDSGNHLIRKCTATTVTTFAGSIMPAGTTIPWNQDGNGTNAKFFTPWGITIDSSDNLYVTDRHGIKKITPSADVTTIVTARRYFNISSVTVDSFGNLYYVEDYVIYKYTPQGVTSILAGKLNTSGYVDDIGENARLTTTYGGYLICDINNNLYISSIEEHTIRKITPDGTVTTVIGISGVRPNKPSVQDSIQTGYLLAGQNLIFDTNDGNIFILTTDVNIDSITINNIDPNNVYNFTFYIKQMGNQAKISWNINGKNVLWSNQGDDRPTLSPNRNDIDVVSITYINGEYYGIDGGQQF